MKSQLLFLAAVFAATFSGFSYAQASKAPVQLLHTGHDSLGQRLAFEVREVIRASQSMRLVVATEADPRIKVHLVTLDPSRLSPGLSTLAAVAITYDGKLVDGNGIFLSVAAQSCGSSRLEECARGIVADIDQEIEVLKRDWPTMARLLR